MLRLFNIGETSGPYPEDQFWLAIWDVDEQLAKSRFMAALQREYGSEFEEGYHKLSVTDVTGKVTESHPESPGEERRTSVQRSIGWWVDGDSSCESCNLFTMDGEYPLCETCGCCEDCCDCANK